MVKTETITNFIKEWSTSTKIDGCIDTALHQAQILCIQSQRIAPIRCCFSIKSTLAAFNSKHPGSFTCHHCIEFYVKINESSERIPFRLWWSSHVKCVVQAMKILAVKKLNASVTQSILVLKQCLQYTYDYCFLCSYIEIHTILTRNSWWLTLFPCYIRVFLLFLIRTIPNVREWAQNFQVTELINDSYSFCIALKYLNNFVIDQHIPASVTTERNGNVRLIYFCCKNIGNISM